MSPQSGFRKPFYFIELPILHLVLLCLAFASAAYAQTDAQLHAYQQVVQQFQNGDLLALERWASAAPAGYLKNNGIALLVWEYHRIGDNSRAQRWASDLLDAQPDNPLALAILSNSPTQPLTETSPHEAGADQALSMAKRALRGLDQMKIIEGMPESAFYSMKTELRRSLEGSIGYAYYQRNDYVTAREYLRRSVLSAPDNAQLVYALAISDLYANPPDQGEGYQMLARAVNLSQGTPAGAELARFAQQKYQEAGGSTANWNSYLANTRSPAPRNSPVEARNAPPAPAESAPAASSPETGGTSAIATSSQPTSANSAPQPAATSATAAPTAPAQPQPSSPPGQTVELARSTPAPDATRPTIAPKPPKQLAPAGAPISLGILIETAAATKANREAVVNSLTDLVRRLRGSDEAFIMSYSKELAFEQDLTDNANALEKAMDNIKPLSGTALYDAVAFASGHLKRISRNQKRVLIVISDGSNGTTRISPLELSGELNVSGVEIYCIGLGADTTADQYRLQALAQRTGGRTMFTNDAAQFRRATQEVAQSIGIPF